MAMVLPALPQTMQSKDMKKEARGLSSKEREKLEGDCDGKELAGGCRFHRRWGPTLLSETVSCSGMRVLHLQFRATLPCQRPSAWDLEEPKQACKGVTQGKECRQETVTGSTSLGKRHLPLCFLG